MNISTDQISSFRSFIWNYYHEHGRQFAWRATQDPYSIFISEIMLQQTQTYRVAPKYEQWLAEFPDFQSLASASLRDVLSVWQGLGYNRRGMYTQKVAQQVVADYQGLLPADPIILETFPGIGKNTAGSICAFAFNMPVVFIETNIRAVYIHSFFKDRDDVHDKELLPLIAQTVDKHNPREWYYALMDYGVLLKQQGKNPSRKSVHHTKQSKFQGSDRQIRGAIIRLLTQHSGLTFEQLLEQLDKDEQRVQHILDQLHKESLLKQEDTIYSIV
jgi:A/G-specific adenine glycosylase